MKAAAKRLEFEGAAQLRDSSQELRAQRIYKAWALFSPLTLAT